MGQTLRDFKMAQIIRDQESTVVFVSTQELNDILIQPAKDLGFIDYDPTRVSIKEAPPDGFEITFERVVSV